MCRRIAVNYWTKRRWKGKRQKEGRQKLNKQKKKRGGGETQLELHITQ
jgi:hypothetical protein